MTKINKDVKKWVHIHAHNKNRTEEMGKINNTKGEEEKGSKLERTEALERGLLSI